MKMRIKKKKTDSSYEYYVHYIDFNRRMDQWITRDQIKLVIFFYNFNFFTLKLIFFNFNFTG